MLQMDIVRVGAMSLTDLAGVIKMRYSLTWSGLMDREREGRQISRTLVLNVRS